jgi:dipeptidyl aminopeptidase/acylaminoacyl peptidase
MASWFIAGLYPAARRYSFEGLRRLPLFVLIALLVGGSAADARHRATDRIAFASTRDGGPYQIYVMNADGSAQTRLTTGDKDDRVPAWSPDGTRIAFHRDQAAPDVWVMNADGSGQLKLTDDPAADLQPSWSPEGTRIVFLSNRDGDYEVFVMGADGTNETQLTFNTANEAFASFSPDGSQILFNSNVDGDHEIYVVSATGGTPIPRTDHPANDYQAIGSTDGAKIAFGSDRDTVFGAVYVMDANGANVTRLTFGSNTDDSPTWSPDGTALAWMRNENIWVMDSDGTDQLQLTTSGNDIDPNWGPRRPRLTIGKAGLGTGSVTAPGIACGIDCTELYGYDASVTLTAAALPGSRFTGWGGACTGLAATCTVTMEATKVVTASFGRVVNGFLCTILGTNGANQIVGTSARDVICALSGNDTARGRGGNDVILLGRGNDQGFGQAGRDRIFGQAGRDTLVGGPNRDRLNGGPGNDACLGRLDIKLSC